MSSTSSNVKLAQDWLAAYNAHDLEKSLSFWSATGTADFPKQSKHFEGTEGLRAWHKDDFAGNIVVTATNWKDTDKEGEVTCEAHVMVDVFPKIGLPDGLRGPTFITIKDGKLQTFRYEA